MTASTSQGRLKTIDGLRGVAAFGVVLYHLNLAVSVTFDNWVHPVIRWMFEQGFLGVDVFFVLSGFVIPFSVRKAELSASFLGRFALRRSTRLDPPYWFAMFLEIGLIWLGLRIGLADSPMPTWPQFFSHFFYLQDLLGYGGIVNIFWTLCFEIQFYLGLIALLVLGRRMDRSIGPEPTRVAAVVVFTALYVISVLGRYESFGFDIPVGFALIRWFQFFMGTCVYWVVTGKTTWRPLVGTWAVLCVVLVMEQRSVLETIPIATSALLWWSYERDQMATILSGRVVQFLGAISYSLYLLHSTVGWRWVRLVGRYLEPDAPHPVVLAVFSSGCLLAILVAWIAWKFLERPSMRLSRVIKLRSRVAAPLQLVDSS